MAAPMNLKLRCFCKNKKFLTALVAQHDTKFDRNLHSPSGKENLKEKPEISVDSEGIYFLKLDLCLRKVYYFTPPTALNKEKPQSEFFLRIKQ
jgi:hypothetical protein